MLFHPAKHYGRFWEFLSQNWGMNFCSCGFIFNVFLNIFNAKTQKTVDHVPSLEIFEIWTKLQLQGLNFELWFWDENFKTGHSAKVPMKVFSILLKALP